MIKIISNAEFINGEYYVKIADLEDECQNCPDRHDCEPFDTSEDCGK